MIKNILANFVAETNDKNLSISLQNSDCVK